MATTTASTSLTGIRLLDDPVAAGRELQERFTWLFETQMFLSALYQLDRESIEGLPVGLATPLGGITEQMDIVVREIQDIIGYDAIHQTVHGTSFQHEQRPRQASGEEAR